MAKENYLIDKVINGALYIKRRGTPQTGLDHLRTAMVLSEIDQYWPEALMAEAREKIWQWRNKTCMSSTSLNVICNRLKRATALGGVAAAEAIYEAWHYIPFPGEPAKRETAFIEVFQAFYSCSGDSIHLHDELAHFSAGIGAPVWMKLAEAAGWAAERNDVTPMQFLTTATAAMFHQGCESSELRRPDEPDATEIFNLALNRAVISLGRLGISRELYSLAVLFDLARLSPQANKYTSLSAINRLGLLTSRNPENDPITRLL